MKFTHIAVFGLSTLVMPLLTGCGGSATDGTESVGSTEQAATTETVSLNAIDFGNWSKTGVRTANDYLTGTVGGVEHAGYFVFDLSSVAGRTATDIEIVLNDAASGFRENITEPKPGLRIPFRPIGDTSIETLTTGNNDTNVFHAIDDQSAENDYAYFYLRSGTGTTAYSLLVYDADRIPAIIKNAKKGTLFSVASWASNVNGDTEVHGNGTGDQFAFNGVTTTPQLRMTLH
jgi:hypothetical protein